MNWQRLGRGDRLRIWLLRRIAGGRGVVMNVRVYGGLVHLESHDPVHGEMLVVECWFDEEKVDA